MDEKAQVIWRSDMDKITKIDYEMYFVVKKDSLFGLTNLAGDMIFPLQYRSINLFQNRYYKIETTENKFGLGDLNGNILIKPIYNEIRLSRFQETPGLWCFNGCDLTVYDTAFNIIVSRKHHRDNPYCNERYSGGVH